MSKKDIELVKQSLFYLPEQILTSWKESCEAFGGAKKQINAIAVFGMGSSGLGADIVKSMMRAQILTPFAIINNYSVPFFVDEKTLCIFSSYSGNTEEVIEAYKEVKKRGAQMCVIATRLRSSGIGTSAFAKATADKSARQAGSKLEIMAQKDKIPAYIINPKYNPAGAPRLGVGYSVGAILGALCAYGVLGLSRASVDMELKRIFPSSDEIKKKTAHFSVLGKVLAKRIFGRVPVLVGSSHLEGAVHTFANEINETAKNFSAHFYLPELDHHLLEGILKPAGLKKNLFFIIFQSELYHPRIARRCKLTAEVLKKNGISNLILNPSQTSLIGEALDITILGCFTAYFLSKLNKVNPLPNPWVDYFKKKLK